MGPAGAAGRRDVPRDRRRSVPRTVGDEHLDPSHTRRRRGRGVDRSTRGRVGRGDRRRVLGHRRRLASLSMDGSGSRRPVLVHPGDAGIGLGTRRRPRDPWRSPGRSQPFRNGVRIRGRRSRHGCRTRFVIDLTAINDQRRWRPASGRAMVIVMGDRGEIRIGEAIEAIGQLASVPGPLNPGEFDYRGYLRGQGIDLRLTVDDPAGLERVPGVRPGLFAQRAGEGPRLEPCPAGRPARPGDRAAGIRLPAGSTRGCGSRGQRRFRPDRHDAPAGDLGAALASAGRRDALRCSRRGPAPPARLSGRRLADDRLCRAGRPGPFCRAVDRDDGNLLPGRRPGADVPGPPTPWPSPPWGRWPSIRSTSSTSAVSSRSWRSPCCSGWCRRPVRWCERSRERSGLASTARSPRSTSWSDGWNRRGSSN